MKRVLTAVVLVPLVLLVVFRAPLWLFALVVGIVILVSLHEYLSVVERYEIKPTRWASYVVAILVVAWVFIRTLRLFDLNVRHHLIYTSTAEIVYWSILLLTPLMFGIPVVFRRDLRMALAASATSAFGVLYIATPLTLLAEMRYQWPQRILVVFVLLAVWVADTAAYYVGKTIGRHNLAPLVSPNTTWEGAIASVAATVLVAWLVFHFFPQIDSLFPEPLVTFYTPMSRADLQMNWIHVAVLALVTNIAAQFGDLFESAIKRGAQVKDSGTLLPGHGGLLDRIDALLFAIPTVWYYAMLTHFLQPGPF